MTGVEVTEGVGVTGGDGTTAGGRVDSHFTISGVSFTRCGGDLTLYEREMKYDNI